MLEEFKEHLDAHFPRLKEAPFLLACSGGLDSVVLTRLCSTLKLDFIMAHCNFQLRGAESDGDEEFVKKLAAIYEKKIFVTHFDTIGYTNKNKVSIQMGARELRYRWFEDIMKGHGLQTVVTGHHADDDLETFLINLSRGTGIDGLSGIPEETAWISRPLLRFSGTSILAYAKAEGLSWREDSSNLETKYLRNRIRHDIVPELKKLHPSFLDNFAKTRAHLHGSAAILKGHIDALRSRLFLPEKNSTKIGIASLVELKPLAAYMHALFKEYGFKDPADVINLFTALSGKEVFSETHRLIKDRTHLLLLEIESPARGYYEFSLDQIPQDLPIRLSAVPVDHMSPDSGSILFVDKETLNPQMVLRKWHKGDYFYPLGLNGKKKVSKFFKDEKFDKVEKEAQWILCSGGDIVWIVGRRPDERFKIRETTTQILKLTVKE